MRSKAFRIIVFDWDGTAVKDRTVDARPVAAALQELLELDVYVVVVTGTNFANIERQFSCHVTGPCKRNLYICTNRGSEVFGFDSRSELFLLYQKERILMDERRKLDSELKTALTEVNTLSGLLPVCSFCKKVRDDKGYWEQIEAYVMSHSQAKFTHGICPACAKKFDPTITATNLGQHP